MSEIVTIHPQFTITIISCQTETWEFLIEVNAPSMKAQQYVASDTEELKNKIAMICEEYG